MSGWGGRRTNIVSVTTVQALHAKIGRGEPLSLEECVALVASHEELRGRALVARERVRHLERDNEMLLDTVKSVAGSRTPDASRKVDPKGR